MLKLAKHVKEAATSATSVVTGQLLGLDIGSTLEVTDAFPFPVRGRCFSKAPSHSGGQRQKLGLRWGHSQRWLGVPALGGKLLHTSVCCRYAC